MSTRITPLHRGSTWPKRPSPRSSVSRTWFRSILAYLFRVVIYCLLIGVNWILFFFIVCLLVGVFFFFFFFLRCVFFFMLHVTIFTILITPPISRIVIPLLA